MRPATRGQRPLTTQIRTPSELPVAVDFETYYDDEVSIKTLGSWCYVHHPQFVAYLVTIISRDGIEFIGDPLDFDWTQLEGRTLVSHNASFDKCVRDMLVETGQIADFTEKAWECTANLSVYLKMGRPLKTAAKNILGKGTAKNIRTTMKGLLPADMAGLMLKAGKKTQVVPLEPGGRSLWEEVCDYAWQDSELCLEIWEQKSHLWPEWERWLGMATTHQCLRGFWIDKPALIKDVAHLQKVKDEAKVILPWVGDDLSDEEGLLSVQKLQAAIKDMGLVPPKSTGEDDLDMQLWEKDPKNAKGVVLTAAMRRLRKSNILLKRCQVLIDRSTPDGRFPYGMRYYGAIATGRWAGGSNEYQGGTGEKGFNVHNFPKKEFEGVDLRKRVIAPKGKKLIIADAAQIEPRVTAVLTNDQIKLKLIRSGMSVYQVHAVQTMGWDPNIELKKADANKYQLSKVRVLGLGYQCGWVKFKDFAASQYSYFMDAKTAKIQVADFRRKEILIVRAWNRLQNEFQASNGGDYEIELPSGRTLSYFDVQPMGRDWVARRERGAKFSKFYGGKLFENAVQATARDVFGHMLMNVEREFGDVTLFHVHDEGVFMVDECVSLKEFEECMGQPYVDMPDLPVGVEAVESPFYCKP